MWVSNFQSKLSLSSAHSVGETSRQLSEGPVLIVSGFFFLKGGGVGRGKGDRGTKFMRLPPAVVGASEEKFNEAFHCRRRRRGRPLPSFLLPRPHCLLLPKSWPLHLYLTASVFPFLPKGKKRFEERDREEGGGGFPSFQMSDSAQEG